MTWTWYLRSPIASPSKNARQSIFLIDKHVTALSRIADRHYMIAKGQVVWSGTSEALRADAPLRQRYLGV